MSQLHAHGLDQLGLPRLWGSCWAVRRRVHGRWLCHAPRLLLLLLLELEQVKVWQHHQHGVAARLQARRHRTQLHVVRGAAWLPQQQYAPWSRRRRHQLGERVQQKQQQQGWRAWACHVWSAAGGGVVALAALAAARLPRCAHALHAVQLVGTSLPSRNHGPGAWHLAIDDPKRSRAVAASGPGAWAT